MCKKTGCENDYSPFYNVGALGYYCSVHAHWLNSDTFNYEHSMKNYGHNMCVVDLDKVDPEKNNRYVDHMIEHNETVQHHNVSIHVI